MVVLSSWVPYVAALCARLTSDRSSHISPHYPTPPRPPKHNRPESAITVAEPATGIAHALLDMIVWWQQEQVKEQRANHGIGVQGRQDTQKVPAPTPAM